MEHDLNELQLVSDSCELHADAFMDSTTWIK
jgi:hypothetical protein